MTHNSFSVRRYRNGTIKNITRIEGVMMTELNYVDGKLMLFGILKHNSVLPKNHQKITQEHHEELISMFNSNEEKIASMKNNR